MKLVLMLGLLLSTQVFAVSADQVQELEKHTVAVVYNTGGGGSGTILKSTDIASYILTNRHVCQGLNARGGGNVEFSTGTTPVDSYKMSETHDLCIIKVNLDLQVDTLLAGRVPEYGTEALVSGHPFLDPQKVTTGNIGHHRTIQIVVGIKPCTKEDFMANPLVCLFMGGFPIVRNYDSISSNILIAPGSSGSGVYNTRNQLIAVAFAGKGRELSQGELVPYEAVKHFLVNEAKTLPFTRVTSDKVMGLEDSQGTVTNDLNALVFPAIMSDNVEGIIESINACKLDNECLNSINR